MEKPRVLRPRHTPSQAYFDHVRDWLKKKLPVGGEGGVLEVAWKGRVYRLPRESVHERYEPDPLTLHLTRKKRVRFVFRFALPDPEGKGVLVVRSGRDPDHVEVGLFRARPDGGEVRVGFAMGRVNRGARVLDAANHRIDRRRLKRRGLASLLDYERAREAARRGLAYVQGKIITKPWQWALVRQRLDPSGGFRARYALQRAPSDAIGFADAAGYSGKGGGGRRAKKTPLPRKRGR